MDFGHNRRALREATSAAHAELDAAVGEFRSAREYEIYLRGIHAFRAAIEPGFEASPIWTPTLIAEEAANDLRDLALAPLDVEPLASNETTPSAMLGRAYVLEGSGLGARLLVRSAQALGFHQEHGARHLWKQADAHENWRAFLVRLEQADVIIDAAIDEAVLSFVHARAAMAAAAHKALNE
jgi:heme oxygenase